jgi:hypothetical protein
MEAEEKSGEKKQSKINPFGGVIHLILIVYCVHAFASYSLHSGFSSWILGLLSLFLPIINLIWVFAGMITFFEINWFVALVLIVLSLLSLIPKKIGTACSIAFVIVFLISTIITAPKIPKGTSYEKYLMDRGVNRFGQNMGNVEKLMGDYANGRISASKLKKEVKKTIKAESKSLKTERARALRMGYKDEAQAMKEVHKEMADQLDNMR